MSTPKEAPTPTTVISPFDLFETDANAEVNGIDIDYGDFYVTVARAGGANDRFGQVLREKMRPHRRAFDLAGDNPSKELDALADRLAAEAFAETVVLAWGSKLYGKGTMVGRRDPVTNEPERLPYSTEAVVAFFEALPDMRRDVMRQASSMANFRRLTLEGDGKNS